MDTASYGVYHAKWNAAVQVLASLVYRIDSASVFEVRGRLPVLEHTSELKDGSCIRRSYTIRSDRGSGGSIYCSTQQVLNVTKDSRNSANCRATFSSGQQHIAFTPYASMRFSSAFAPFVPGSPSALSALSWVSLPPFFPPFLA